ncbi:MAG: hypothetical protein ACRDTE_09445 [Pseudonocardiaceae bacterium]
MIGSGLVRDRVGSGGVGDGVAVTSFVRGGGAGAAAAGDRLLP